MFALPKWGGYNRRGLEIRDLTITTGEDQQTQAGGVVQRLIRYIKAEQLQPGDRLPSIRQLAQDWGVGRNAVRDGLLEAKTLGLVDLHPRAGAFVRGENRLRVTLGNPGNELSCRLVVNVSEAAAGAWQRRYRLICPAGRTTEMALGFALPRGGVHEVDLVCFTPGLRRPCFIVSRRGVRPREPMTTPSARLQGDTARIRIVWPFKTWEWGDLSLVVTLRDSGGGVTLAHKRVRGLKGPGAEVAVALTGMERKGREVRVSLLRRKALVASRKWDLPAH